MNTFISPALDAADLLALARLDDDGASPAVSSPRSADGQTSQAYRVARTGQPTASQAEATGRLLLGGGCRRHDHQGPGTEALRISKLAAFSLADRASVWLVRSQTEEPEQAGGGDPVGVADADDPTWKLLPAGEVIRFGAAQA